MKILQFTLPKLLALVAVLIFSVAMNSGCGHGTSSYTPADLPSDDDPDDPTDPVVIKTPASLGAARDLSGNLLIAFYDENGDPLPVDTDIFEEQLSVEIEAGLSAMAAKAESVSGADSFDFQWSRYKERVKIVTKGLSSCLAFELCIGEGVISADCSAKLDAGEVEECHPLDVDGCYEFPASKASNDLFAVDGESGCYDDFVIATQEYIPVPAEDKDELDERMGEALARANLLVAYLTACGDEGRTHTAELLREELGKISSFYEAVGGEPEEVEPGTITWDPVCVPANCDCWWAHLNLQINEVYEPLKDEIYALLAFKVSTISVYAGSSSLSPVWTPAISIEHTGGAIIKSIADRPISSKMGSPYPFAVVGNVDGGDAPKVIFGGPFGDTGKERFVAVPVADGALPAFESTFANYAVLHGRIDEVYDAGDIDGDGIEDLILIGGVWASLIRGGSLEAGLTDIDSPGVVSISANLIKNPTAVAAGANINGTILSDDQNDDMVSGVAGRVGLKFGFPIVDGMDAATLAPDVVISTEDNDDEFGYSVALGDVDGDGYADVLASAPGITGFSERGGIYLFGGGKSFPSEMTGTDSFMVIGEDTLDETYLGVSVVFLGDVNQDGYGDFAAASIDKVSENVSVHLFLGGEREDLLGSSKLGVKRSTATALSIKPLSDGDIMAPIALGDINGDGSKDFGIPYMYGEDKNEVAFCIFLGGSYLDATIASATAKVIDVTDADVIFEDFGDGKPSGIAGRMPR